MSCERSEKEIENTLSEDESRLTDKIAEEHLQYLKMTKEPTIIFSRLVGVWAHNIGGVEWGNVKKDDIDTLIEQLKEKCPEIEVKEFY